MAQRYLLFYQRPQEFSKTGVIEAVPRHLDIKEPLARKILKSMNAE